MLMLCLIVLLSCSLFLFFFFFFNDTATTEIYTLSLHDALPISVGAVYSGTVWVNKNMFDQYHLTPPTTLAQRSEEHTSELQSHVNLVCRLLLEKKKKKTQI